MKVILLLALLSLYYCEYCDDKTEASGLNDCKDLQIKAEGGEDVSNKTVVIFIIKLKTKKIILMKLKYVFL